MNIWIIEEKDDVARKACEVAADLACERLGEHAESVKIYRVKTIEWPPELFLFGGKEEEAPADCAKAKPAIVVLDLFDNGFKAGAFFQALREWERNSLAAAPTLSRHQRSFVILWTGKSCREDVIAFLQQARERDRRVNFTETKSRISLRQQLEGFWRQWDEEKYQ